jgi:hypothetical protein
MVQQGQILFLMALRLVVVVRVFLAEVVLLEAQVALVVQVENRK